MRRRFIFWLAAGSRFAVTTTSALAGILSKIASPLPRSSMNPAAPAAPASTRTAARAMPAILSPRRGAAGAASPPSVTSARLIGRAPSGAAGKDEPARAGGSRLQVSPGCASSGGPVMSSVGGWSLTVRGSFRWLGLAFGRAEVSAAHGGKRSGHRFPPRGTGGLGLEHLPAERARLQPFGERHHADARTVGDAHRAVAVEHERL